MTTPYPTPKEVEEANRLTLCCWHRFLPSPTEEQLPILNRIEERYKEAGGMSPEISKMIGWGRLTKWAHRANTREPIPDHRQAEAEATNSDRLGTPEDGSA